MWNPGYTGGMEFTTTDFAPCGDCGHWVQRQELTDVDGDGYRYCRRCAAWLEQAWAAARAAHRRDMEHQEAQ